MTRKEREETIEEACLATGCDKDKAARHYRLFVNEHWHCHPSKAFKEWHRTDRYCIDSEVGLFAAWNTQHFRDLFMETCGMGWDEFDAEPPKPLTEAEIETMTARQKAKFPALKHLISQIGKPVPDPLPTDYDKGAIGKPSYHKDSPERTAVAKLAQKLEP